MLLFLVLQRSRAIRVIVLAPPCLASCVVRSATKFLTEPANSYNKPSLLPEMPKIEFMHLSRCKSNLLKTCWVFLNFLAGSFVRSRLCLVLGFLYAAPFSEVFIIYGLKIKTRGGRVSFPLNVRSLATIKIAVPSSRETNNTIV
jgi:hypothetical protein